MCKSWTRTSFISNNTCGRQILLISSMFCLYNSSDLQFLVECWQRSKSVRNKKTPPYDQYFFLLNPAPLISENQYYSLVLLLMWINSSGDEIYNADHTGVHAHKWRCFKKGLEKNWRDGIYTCTCSYWSLIFSPVINFLEMIGVVKNMNLYIHLSPK
jgi:hypothetical protein